MKTFLFYLFIMSIIVLAYYFGKLMGWVMHQEQNPDLSNSNQEIDQVIDVSTIDVGYDKNGLLKYDLVYLEKEGEYSRVYNAEIIDKDNTTKKGKV